MSETKFLFLPVKSNISQDNDIANFIFEKLTNIGGHKADSNEINSELPFFILVLTGGTERKIINLVEERKNYFKNEPVILFAHSGNNSLPASLEILAYLKQNNVHGKIIYIDESLNKDIFNEIEKLIKYFSVYHQLRKIKVGLIGEPSDWLIASNPNNELINLRFGIEVIKIQIEELINEIKTISEKEIEEEYFQLTKKAIEIKEPSKNEIKDVVKIYSALNRIIKKYSLGSVSVRCFDLVTELKTTGCFALSKLNDDGIIAGCEGDLASTIGMIWLNLMTEQSVWMANPSQINEDENTILLAHCTVPISLTEKYKLRSHFESGIGVGIQGELSKGKITLLRIGGKNLDKIWTTNGEIVEPTYMENLCRTQVKIKLHGNNISELLNNPLGNHILMIRGHYAKELLQWWELFIQN